MRVIIVGTDTDAGKTVLSAYWMSTFADFSYWKPLETGEADSARVRTLVPSATIHKSVLHLQEAVAPALAARNAGVQMPNTRGLLAARPSGNLLIETFGGPFSPLDDSSLQLEWIKAADAHLILVTSSSVGAIGRTFATTEALAAHGVVTKAVVLMGPRDPYAEECIGKKFNVFSLPGFEHGTPAFTEHRATLEALRATLQPAPDNALLARDKKVTWHPYTALLEQEPMLPVVSARDEFLKLQDGRQIIDGISSWWTILHAHGHAPLLTALNRAAATLDHVIFAGATHEPGVALAELLLSSAKMGDGRVFYSDNGSTAIEVALKMAFHYWTLKGEQRARFIGFENGYHGDTFGAMSVSRDPVFFGRFEPLLCQADIIPLDPAALAAALEKHPVAAVIIEPRLQAAGGMRFHSAQTLEEIARVTKAHGTLLIADEVMTGGGRLGMRWASEIIRPDILCAAKTLCGGLLSLAATLVSKDVAAAFESPERAQAFFHGHSFTGHPLACAVALANAQLPTDAARIEAFWKKRLPHARVMGSLVATNVEAKSGYLSNAAARMRAAALNAGVLLRPLGNVLYALPPLLTSDASLEQIAQAFEAAEESARG
jgi:adenosylmethionine-8-amino-7-oxononanoate aminotransferase